MNNSKEFIENIRKSRLRSYQSTPGDVEEHRRAELRVAGDTAGRPLIELIQNADDAMNQASDLETKRIIVRLAHDKLIVANDGTPFTPEGVEAICNLDRSPKKNRRITIGNKGIGFKAVLTWSMHPVIHSRTFEFTFDREMSAEEISNTLGMKYESQSVPLMRLPFTIDYQDNSVKELFQEGFATVIVLPLKTEAVIKSILDELYNFDPLTLLFLNSVSCFYIDTEKFDRKFRVIRKENQIEIMIGEDIETYDIFKSENEIPNSISSILPEDCRDLTHALMSIAIPKNRLKKYCKLFSHFPTLERCPFKFLIHGDFISDAGRKHLRDDANKYNQWVIDKIADLFVDKILSFYSGNIPTVIDLLECRATVEMEAVEKKVFDTFVKSVSALRFLPVMNNPLKLVSPSMASLAKKDTIDDINRILEGEITWRERHLIDKELNSKSRIETLKKLGGKEIKKPNFIKLIALSAKPNPKWCTYCLDIVLKWIEGAPSWSDENESKSDIAQVLKDQNLFLTNNMKLRSLNEYPPLFILPAGKKVMEIPSFIPLDFLHTEIGSNLEKEKYSQLDKYGLHPFKAREIIEKAVLPIIENNRKFNQNNTAPNKDLLIFLSQLEPNQNKFEKTDPYPWFDNIRERLAYNVLVPIEGGKWLPGWKVYANKDWGAPDELISIYVDAPDRSFLSPPNDPIHDEISIEKWKALYRFFGVSWEPKILPIEKSPVHISRYSFPNPHSSHISEDDWNRYKQYISENKSLSDIDMWRWTVNIEESYVLDNWKNIRQDPNKNINLLNLLYKTDIFDYIAGNQKEKVKNRFKYTKISYSYSAHCDSFLVWGIKELNWIPSKKGNLFSPDKIYIEDSEIGKNLRGIIPTIKIERPTDKNTKRRFEDLLDELGIKNNFVQISLKDWECWVKFFSDTDVLKIEDNICDRIRRTYLTIMLKEEVYITGINTFLAHNIR